MTISNKSNVTYNAVMPDGKPRAERAESNTVSTEILSYAVPKILACDKTSVQEGETVRKKVTVTNNGTTKLFNNFFTIPEFDGVSFIEGSVKINGAAKPDFNPAKGLALEDLSPGETAVIEYDVKINERISAPTVKHCAKFDYTVFDPARGNVSYSENTNTLLLNVVSGKLDVSKRVDKSFAVRGEKLHYVITVANNGTVTKSNIVFKDPIPDGTAFIANSVKINGASYAVYNPEIGFALQSLTPGEVRTVEFDVQVN